MAKSGDVCEPMGFLAAPRKVLNRFTQAASQALEAGPLDECLPGADPPQPLFHANRTRSSREMPWLAKIPQTISRSHKEITRRPTIGWSQVPTNRWMCPFHHHAGRGEAPSPLDPPQATQTAW
jgi:hypothetical protein